MAQPFDTIIRAGRFICCTTGVDESGAVTVRDGRVVAAGADVNNIINFADFVLVSTYLGKHSFHWSEGNFNLDGT